ncbi:MULTISPECIES: DegT/DnrJ/EryC1/StrS family aminotransferase [unclassified Acinetobacter]|uniref:DegT/DnrJ/EryC1/StrS family aminotransferase n=1 Tax=unclassified Acinetobacter TaxID=196816 RepID=UPI002934EFF2|nr:MULTISPECIES: DegT/DnrJ/EryC1/StrS family aminotransferase [unclassified Acinetobacter]WOE31850.1 DegT/DnrJ/EryC1/StrS family aminotransferase [Acinetobacter sp. SAAs470]WOE37317.1 DegT/DnrJ/EryC1/StrS family aminotransferase [Acinetobacter sp. SAAs474]
MYYEIPPTAGLAPQFQDLYDSPDLALNQKIAQLLNIPIPALTCSGTVALILSLEVLQQRCPHRNQVIIPAWTCPLVVLAVEKIGLVPVLCDLSLADYVMDEMQLVSLVNNNTLAIIVTHYAGLVYPFEQIQTLAKNVGCYIIEDAAQALGAQDKGQSVGLRGDIGFFSLAFGKGLTSAEGGLVFSRHSALHQELHDKAQQLPQLFLWELKRCFELIGYYLFYHPLSLTLLYGYPRRKSLDRHDEIAAVGDDFGPADIPIHQLGRWRSQVAANAAERLPDYWQKLRQQAHQRIAQLRQLSYLKVFCEAPHTQSNFPFLLIIVYNSHLCKKILNELWRSHLGVTKLFVHAIADYPHLAHIKAVTPNAVQFAASSFTISNSLWLDDEKFSMILNVLKKYDLQD